MGRFQISRNAELGSRVFAIDHLPEPHHQSRLGVSNLVVGRDQSSEHGNRLDHPVFRRKFKIALKASEFLKLIQMRADYFLHETGRPVASSRKQPFGGFQIALLRQNFGVLNVVFIRERRRIQFNCCECFRGRFNIAERELRQPEMEIHDFCEVRLLEFFAENLECRLRVARADMEPSPDQVPQEQVAEHCGFVQLQSRFKIPGAHLVNNERQPQKRTGCAIFVQASGGCDRLIEFSGNDKNLVGG